MLDIPAISKKLLTRYAIFGAALAFAGPPIYIHLPQVYAEQHGMSLAVIGTVLLGLRAIDFIQDPLLAWAIARWHAFRPLVVVGCVMLLCISMVALFAIPPLFHPVAWLSLSLIGVFTSFSALHIIYYSSGVELASQKAGSHEQVASWRETGALVGICLACITPSVFGYFFGSERTAYALYAVTFAGLMVLAVLLTRQIWQQPFTAPQNSSFLYLLQDKGTRRLLILGFINALPVGLTATLFFFFVNYRLEAPGHAGPLLLLFFLSAALASNFWGRLAQRWGAMPTLRCGMVLAIVSFGFASFLGAGDVLPFYAISIVSGMSLSADMTLLPAMLAARVSRVGAGREQAFGLWGFVNKATLAIAAGTALPALAAAGFVPGDNVNASTLPALTFAYAILPCILKLIAVAMLSVLISHQKETI